MQEEIENTQENTTESVEKTEDEMVEKDKYVRLYSDFENYKRRSVIEKDEYFRSSNQKIILEILPTLDNFERAGELEKGIQIIFDNLKKTLSKLGVQEVEAKGLDFNPDLMEAITQIPSEDLKGKIVDIIEKGYQLNGKIIRFAKVVVGC